MSTILCVFHSVGIVSLFKLVVNKWCKGAARGDAQLIRIVGVILSIPPALFGISLMRA